jgi:hypothetical protein
MEQRNIKHQTIDIDSIQPHPKNVRQGDIGAISESLKAHGQYRPIVVDKRTNQILAGNHTWKAAKSLGWSQIAVGFIETKDDDDATRILLADNRTTDLASYDDAGLANLLKDLAETEEGLDGTGFDGDALDELLADIENQNRLQDEFQKYTQTLKAPQYEIVGEKPQISELADFTKYNQLVDQIKKLEPDTEISNFLNFAAARHIVFNYQKIAEYYPHQTPQTQKLMEQSALVIIDANDAIANGYAVFATTMKELLDSELNEPQ